MKEGRPPSKEGREEPRKEGRGKKKEGRKEPRRGRRE